MGVTLAANLSTTPLIAHSDHKGNKVPVNSVEPPSRRQPIVVAARLLSTSPATQVKHALYEPPRSLEGKPKVTNRTRQASAAEAAQNRILTQNVARRGGRLSGRRTASGVGARYRQ